MTLISFISIQCKKEATQIVPPSPQFSQQQDEEGEMVLGQQLNNPYTVANMQQALLELQSENFPGANAVTVTTTHRYIKFSPAEEDELDLLLIDTLIDYYDYPLDYEIETDGIVYHDPSLSGDVPTFHYASIPIGHTYPSTLTHTVLADLFLPDELFYGDIYGNPLGMSEALVDALVERAFFIANVDYDEESNKTMSNDPPQGNIKAFDDVVNGMTPVQGVKVYANRWFTTYTALTAPNGNFVCNGKFKKKFSYKIKWKRVDFIISDGWYAQAKLKGPSKTTGSWNANIARSSNPKNLAFATIFRAAFRMNHGDNLGLPRPTIYNKPYRICYIQSTGNQRVADYWSLSTDGLFPDIRIYGKDDNNELRSSNDIFATTTHEIAHLGHCMDMGNIQYWQVNNLIAESWAEVVEWQLTSLEYQSLGFTNYSYRGALQWWKMGVHSADYTPLFCDLIDDFNQRNGGTIQFDTNDNYTISGGDDYPIDNVSGYTLANLFNQVLPNSYGLTSLATALKNNKLSGVTDQQIDELISNY